MSNKTEDIETAIKMVVDPGEQITLSELDTLLLSSYPSLAGVDRRWIGAAVSRMLQDGRLLADDPDAECTATFTVRRPA